VRAAAGVAVRLVGIGASSRGRRRAARASVLDLPRVIVTDLDAEIAALRAAVDARDEADAAERLAVIERALGRLNPLLRGMTYAHVQAVLGRPERAAAVLEDLLELMPEDGMIHHQLGCYRRAARDDEGALAAFTRATELDATRVDAWLERGTLLDARGEPQRAIEAYRQVILRAPAEVDGWRNLGNSLAALACFDQAIEAYRTALRLAPGDETLAFLQASAHQAKGDLEAANAGLPAAVRERVGQVAEVRVQALGLELRCRFHAPPERLEARRSAAEALLHAVAPELTAAPETLFPWPRGRSFVVRQEAWLLVCDRDAVRPGPHRFFDATETVEGAAQHG
jgi:tetratricopeptide (TPR) repeat protein